MQRTVANDLLHASLISTTPISDILPIPSNQFRSIAFCEANLDHSMSVSLFRSRTPYVCNTCKIQLKGRLPSPRLGSRQTSTQLPSTKDLEQSAKFVKERVKHLGGSQALSASFPRWQRRKDVSSMSAAVFMSTCEQKYETLRNGSFQRNENITVYGMLHLSPHANSDRR